MAQIGLHALISFKLKKYLPQKRYFFTFFLLGSILPDSDIVICAIISFFTSIEYSVNLHRTFSHSIVTTLFLYFISIIISEIKKNKRILIISNGLLLGIIFHIGIDILFWFDGVNAFWPLPIPEINIWANFPYIIPDTFKNIMLLFEFIFFRLLAYKIMQILIKRPLNNGYYLKFCSIWMKCESYFFITFITALIINNMFPHIIDNIELLVIFGILYIPSLIMALISIYIVRKNIN